VCRTRDRLRMSLASMDLHGPRIESGSGMYWSGYFIYAYVTYDQVYYDVVYGSLTVFR
jgi:hypothetical protein